MDVRKEAKQILMSEGLSENAAKTYLALLSMGSGNLSGISTQTKLHPQSVKNSLLELTKHSLVTKVGHKLSRTLYKPVAPYIVSRRIHDRHERYVKLLPDLAELFRQKKTRFFSAYEGPQALANQLFNFLDSMQDGSTLYIQSYPGQRFADNLGNLYERLETLRITKKVSKHVLVGNKEAKSLKDRPDLLNEAKSEHRLNKLVDGPQVTFISGERVLYYFADMSEPTVVVIESKEYATQALKLFTHLWAPSPKF